MNKSQKTALAIVIILLAVVFTGVKYTQSLAYLTVSWTNTSKVEAYTVDNTNKPAAVSTQSGTALKLHKGSYFLHYFGAPGYADAYKIVVLSDRKQSVDFSPYYSESHLASLRDRELPAITIALSAQFPTIADYQVKPGKLYYRGEWYGTSLVYTGADFINTDKLRVVLHKSGDQWTIATAKPDVTLSKLLYPDIPREILDDVNKQL